MKNRILVTVLLFGFVAIAALSQWNRSSRSDIVRCEECMRLPDLQRYVDLARNSAEQKGGPTQVWSNWADESHLLAYRPNEEKLSLVISDTN